jgi:hypothetical protein
MIEMNVYQKTLVRDVYVVVLEQACAHGSAAAQGPIFWGPKISMFTFYIANTSLSIHVIISAGLVL